ncbi:DMT family transporter [Pararhodobacter zhoushanensis]|uniref:DMT family transporter n=1 Tax=Pararhodobacter zhoushanensis TaxID=2479545 RepID=UPI000F8CB509|nr:DMT family transporter [Pararhodobacter zhoushanensis]
MMAAVIFALGGGMLIALSRQVNGRLALQSSALESSFWNHLVGFAALIAITAAVGSFWPDGVENAPWYAWAGGAVGVVFVAAGSWLIPRLGATMTGALLVAGQMLSGVTLDVLRGVDAVLWMQIGGVALILGGVLLARR